MSIVLSVCLALLFGVVIRFRIAVDLNDIRFLVLDDLHRTEDGTEIEDSFAQKCDAEYNHENSAALPGSEKQEQSADPGDDGKREN